MRITAVKNLRMIKEREKWKEKGEDYVQYRTMKVGEEKKSNII